MNLFFVDRLLDEAAYQNIEIEPPTPQVVSGAFDDGQFVGGGDFPQRRFHLLDRSERILGAVDEHGTRAEFREMSSSHLLWLARADEADRTAAYSAFCEFGLVCPPTC